jgi:hypothetical protein
MKSFSIILIISTVSLLFAFQIAIIAVLFFPEVFTPIAGEHFMEARTFGTPVTEETDSQVSDELDDSGSHISGDGIEPVSVLKDTIAVRDWVIETLRESMKEIEEELRIERQRNSHLISDNETLRARLDGKDTEDMRTMAKMLESMSPEDAARILQSTTDKEVREAILLVNRRQAARIMSLLDPDRAARIMKFTVIGND